MRTTKPISTISFNTTAYLTLKLEEFRRAGRISFWALILHKPEDDEGGKKPHHHVYVEPSKMLQTDDLKADLRELDPQRPDKPLGCLTFTFSKFGDWYMYALHDPRYLASKGQERKFHYQHDDIASSDEDDLLCKARMIDMLSLSPYADMQDAIRHGLSWDQYFARGRVPIPQIRQFQEAWSSLTRHVNGGSKTERNGREGHLNELTGEWVEDQENGSEAENSPQGSAWIGDDDPLDDLDPLPFLEDL